jgi:hypothetical protein
VTNSFGAAFARCCKLKQLKRQFLRLTRPCHNGIFALLVATNSWENVAAAQHSKYVTRR